MDKGFKFKLRPVLRLKEVARGRVKKSAGKSYWKINSQIEMINNYREKLERILIVMRSQKIQEER